jgi:hypothetical protein
VDASTCPGAPTRASRYCSASFRPTELSGSVSKSTNAPLLRAMTPIALFSTTARRGRRAVHPLQSPAPGARLPRLEERNLRDVKGPPGGSPGCGRSPCRHRTAAPPAPAAPGWRTGHRPQGDWHSPGVAVGRCLPNRTTAGIGGMPCTLAGRTKRKTRLRPNAGWWQRSQAGYGFSPPLQTATQETQQNLSHGYGTPIRWHNSDRPTW